MTKEEFFQDRRFFFDDPKASAGYALRYSKDECMKIIKNADDTIAQSFIFNLRWDLEQTQIPVVFEGEIDWLRQPGDDPEFIYAFNRMRFWICLGQAYALTGDEKYAKCFTKQLMHWIRTVPFSPESKAWRTIETGIRMEHWCKAIQYFRSSPYLTDEVIDAFVASVTEHAEYIMSVWNSYNLLSNWGILANHGLFVASLVLPQSARTEAWRKTAIERLVQEAEIQIYDDGVHWEQSAMYHNEVLHCMLDVVLLAKRLSVALPESFVERIHKAALYSALMQKPDGSEPMSGDSDDIDQRDLTEKSAYIFSDPVIRGFGEDHMTFDALWDCGSDAAAEYEEMDIKTPSAKLFSFPDSGHVVYRSAGTYLSFKDGPIGAGHSHADQTHIDLCIDGEDVLIDPGRYTYVDKSDRYEFKDSHAHNIVTIDGADSYTKKDSWEYSKMSESYGLKWKEKNGMAFIKGGHLGYIFSSSFVSRKVVVLDEKTIAVIDECYGRGEHSAQCYWHFSEKGKTEILSDNSFSFNTERSNVCFTAINGEGIISYPSRISRHYNQAESNVSIKVSRAYKDFGSFITVITDGNAEIEKLPVKSNFKGITFSDREIEAVRIGSYILAVSHYEWGSPTDSFSVDGYTGWGRLVVFTSGDGDIGTVLEA